MFGADVVVEAEAAAKTAEMEAAEAATEKTRAAHEANSRAMMAQIEKGIKDSNATAAAVAQTARTIKEKATAVANFFNYKK